MALVLVLQVVYALISPPDFARKSLRDADSYMRVLRVVDLHDKGRWYDSHFDRTNAPFGETLHWGRPLDALLYGMAWPIARFVDFRTAAFLSGMFLGPVLMLLSIPLWSWGTRPTLSDGAFLLLFGLMSMTTQLRGQLELARPDHHGFLIVLFVAQFAAVCRLATRSGGRKTAVILGIAGGVALWASVEGLLVQAAFALTLAYLLLRGMEDAIGCIAAYAISFWATVTIALMLERPPNAWLTPDYIRISIVHWTLAAAVALTWWALLRFSRATARPSSRAEQLVTLAVGGGVPLAVMACTFPRFFQGPLVGHDPALMAAWFATIQEFQPLLPTSLDRLLFFLIHFGPVLVGLGLVIHNLVNDDRGRRDLHAVSLGLLAIFGALALSSARWVIYAQALSLAPWAFALWQITQRPKPIRFSAARYVARLASVGLLCCGPFLTATVGASFIPMPSYVANANACNWAGIESFLVGLHARDERDDIIFTYLYRGPEIVWHTSYRVVSAPYGNDDALRDTNLIFEARSDSAARRRIDARGVALILVCRDEPENDLYRKPGDGSLLSRLETGDRPQWLQPVALPEELGSSFELFRIVGN